MEEVSIHIFYIKHTEKLPADIFQRLLLQLPALFQHEIKSYKHWEGAQASLLGKIILSYGFEKLNLNYSLHNIQIGEKDRPFINDEVDFNISHSGEYIICAIAQHAKVGVDIEKHRTLNISLFRKYFDNNEWGVIQTSSIPQKTFFDLWSIKESAIKCDGRGVEVLGKTHVFLSLANSLSDSKELNCDGDRFYFQQLDIDLNYACSVCSNKEFKKKLTMLSLPDLLDV